MAQPVARPSDGAAQAEASYRRWREELRTDPRYRAIYEEEAARGELWLQLVAAREAAGLTQAELAERLGVSPAQVARIEKRGYDVSSLNTLRRYLQALGGGFTLEVAVRRTDGDRHPIAAATG